MPIEKIEEIARRIYDKIHGQFMANLCCAVGNIYIFLNTNYHELAMNYSLIVFNRAA